MRLLSGILLILFVIFSALPSLLLVIDKETDISMLITGAEEEESNNLLLELKILFKINKLDYMCFLGIHYEFFQLPYIENKLLTLPSEVIVPPPKCIIFFA